MNKLTTEEFIQRAKKIHGDKYDYTNTVYTGYHDQCVIFCTTHGDFPQEASNHLKGCGCPFCGKAKTSKKITREEFIERAIEIYGDKYNYKEIFEDYFSSKSKQIILCKEHGAFFKTPDKFLNAKQGCPKCARLSE